MTRNHLRKLVAAFSVVRRFSLFTVVEWAVPGVRAEDRPKILFVLLSKTEPRLRDELRSQLNGWLSRLNGPIPTLRP